MDNPFLTVYKGDFIWPYIAPIIFKPREPPDCPAPPPPDNGKRNLIQLEPCQCDRHSWSPHFARARHLKMKEDAFREAMVAVAAQRAVLEKEIIEHPCTDSEDVVASLYQLNFNKKNFPVVAYRPMMADHDDPVVTPVAMLKTGLDNLSYQDPTKFRSIAIKVEEAGAPRKITFHKEPQEEVQFSQRSEYQDSISKTGAETTKAALQFKEPVFSTRRRKPCSCL
ncbi:hypothetical protein GE061_007280 [Apolygus lucorum]|uniref:Uncharacterized protein n=1 Tax=Apolygus lucorum TaxID=248454 RepID=A0A6A4IWW6_APOLU|nr:hypothetical protein GE061_007280 [Apolygus lucorum]